MSPTLFPVLGFSLTSDRVSLAELRDFADLVARPELSRLPGVADVVVQGGRKLEARVELDPVALASRNLDAATVVEGSGTLPRWSRPDCWRRISSFISPWGRAARDLARLDPS